MDRIDLLLKNAAVWTPGGFVDADIAVKDGKIAALGKPPVLPDTAAAMIDAQRNEGDSRLDRHAYPSPRSGIYLQGRYCPRRPWPRLRAA